MGNDKKTVKLRSSTASSKKNPVTKLNPKKKLDKAKSGESNKKKNSLRGIDLNLVSNSSHNNYQNLSKKRYIKKDSLSQKSKFFSDSERIKEEDDDNCEDGEEKAEEVNQNMSSSTKYQDRINELRKRYNDDLQGGTSHDVKTTGSTFKSTNKSNSQPKTTSLNKYSTLEPFPSQQNHFEEEPLSSPLNQSPIKLEPTNENEMFKRKLSKKKELSPIPYEANSNPLYDKSDEIENFISPRFHEGEKKSFQDEIKLTQKKEASSRRESAEHQKRNSKLNTKKAFSFKNSTSSDRSRPQMEVDIKNIPNRRSDIGPWMSERVSPIKSNFYIQSSFFNTSARLINARQRKNASNDEKEMRNFERNFNLKAGGKTMKSCNSKLITRLTKPSLQYQREMFYKREEKKDNSSDMYLNVPHHSRLLTKKELKQNLFRNYSSVSLVLDKKDDVYKNYNKRYTVVFPANCYKQVMEAREFYFYND